MTIKQKISVILQESGLTQEALARQLGVSFPTVNSWALGKSEPREAFQKRIDNLYRFVSGEATLSREELNRKWAHISARKKMLKNPLKRILERPDLKDEFLLQLTFHSNHIEGNTLTIEETASVLFDRFPLADKTLVEQLEVKNHQSALLALFSDLPRVTLDEEWLLKMHLKLMNGIREDAGNYRCHAVRIVGAFVPTANPLRVPSLMEALVPSFEEHPRLFFEHLAQVHAEFERIHPFSDGNGRVGRLLLCAMLLKAGFPPAVIREDKRRLYYAFLKKAQLEGDTSLLEDFIMDAVLQAYELFE